jgi:hypothetical protein
MFSADAFILDRTKIPRELHNAHFFSIHATKSTESICKASNAISAQLFYAVRRVSRLWKRAELFFYALFSTNLS